MANNTLDKEITVVLIFHYGEKASVLRQGD